MFDLCAERLFDDEEVFAGRNGHRFVEMWASEGREIPAFRSGELRETEISNWVQEKQATNGAVLSGMRILLSPKASIGGKLPFSKDTYRTLSSAWRIPITFLRAVAQKLSTVTQCSVAPLHSSSHRGSLLVEDPENNDASDNITSSVISDSARCLLIRGDVDWTWDYALYQSFDPITDTLHATVVGLTATEIDLLTSYLSRISSNTISQAHPALLPLLLIDLATDETASQLKVRLKILSQIQQRTGMDRFSSLKSAMTASTGGHTTQRQDLDLDAIMLRLTCLSDWVAAQRGFLDLQARVASLVSTMLTSSSSTTTPLAFSERLTFIRSTLLAAEAKCLYLERSISAQVQTVYSLIAQKDNRLNTDAARASCQLAADSRHIAILTRRDSTDMRIIAAVTMIFLPGTFVATVFSTGLFDWGFGDPTPAGGDDESGGQGRLVSRYIWVYFMLTGVLTAVVLVAWGIFSCMQNRKMVRRFGAGVEEEGWSGDEWDGKGDRGVKKRRDTESTWVEGRRRMKTRKWRIMLARLMKGNRGNGDGHGGGMKAA